MSLRFQINLRILLSALCILLLGGSITIWQARNTINEEIDSSINLALQLIQLGFSQNQAISFDDNTWLRHLASLEFTRHLKIQLLDPSGKIIAITSNKDQKTTVKLPPKWFISLVSHDYSKAEHQITTLEGKQISLLIEANPLDEITEFWQESYIYNFSIIALTLLTFLVVNLVFNKSFKAITTIVNALKLIESGQYQHKLPNFDTLEYDCIANAINHMTCVLDNTQQQNTALTQHSLQIHEEERQKLAQELHDELGQSLTAIKALAISASHSTSDTHKTCGLISKTSSHLMSVVRTMMQQLHPLILTELGLKASLEELIGHWSERNSEIHITLECDTAVSQLDPKITIHIYRVVQECLTNITRHAQASEVNIHLVLISNIKPTLQLRIYDNGQGCVLENINSGFGLPSMKERIKSLGGQLIITTQPGQGMTNTASIPL